MKELGRIIPERRYQTTDGRTFDDFEEALKHQEELNKGELSSDLELDK